MGLDDQIACLRNELKRRKKVYPVLVESGRIEKDYADLEIVRMAAALETLSQLKGIATRG